MPLIEYLREHGGEHIASLYIELEKSLTLYQKLIDEMHSLEGTEGMVLNIPGVGIGVTLVDSDEPFVFAHAMDKQAYEAGGRIRTLTNLGWGRLPLVQEWYESIMGRPFPADYIGHELPPEYVVIDGKLKDPPTRLIGGSI